MQLTAALGHAGLLPRRFDRARVHRPRRRAGRSSCGAGRRPPARRPRRSPSRSPATARPSAMDGQLIGAMPARRTSAPRGHRRHRRRAQPLHRPARPAPAGAVEAAGAGRDPVVHPWHQHLYAERAPLPLARKHELVPRWMDRRWAGFRRYRAANLRALDRLLALCRAKGLRPVLLELPLDVRVVRQRPRQAAGRRIATAVRRLARRHHARYLVAPATRLRCPRCPSGTSCTCCRPGPASGSRG